MSARNEAHLLSGAYALDAVTPEEAAAVEAAMRESEELRGEVVGLTDTAVALGSAVPAAAPPPALRAALLQAIERTPQLSAEEPEPVPAAAETAAGTTAGTASRLAEAAHAAPRRRRARRRPAVLLSLAAVAVLLFGGGVLVTRALVQPDLQYSAIVAASDARVVTGAVTGGGQAKVTWSRSEGAAAVELKGVAVPEGRVLQVWSTRGGRIQSLGLYEAGAHYRVVDDVPAGGEGVAVSIEPAGGSKQPTTDPIVQIPLGA